MCAGAGCSHGLTSSDLVGRRRSLCAAGEGNGRVVCPPGTPWLGSLRVCPPSFDAGQLWWFDRGRVCGRAPVKLLGPCATCGAGSCRSGLVLRLVVARIHRAVALRAVPVFGCATLPPFARLGTGVCGRAPVKCGAAGGGHARRLGPGLKRCWRTARAAFQLKDAPVISTPLAPSLASAYHMPCLGLNSQCCDAWPQGLAHHPVDTSRRP